VPPTGTEGAEVPPTGTEGAPVNTPEEIALVNSREKVEGQDLPLIPRDGSPLNYANLPLLDTKTAQAVVDAYDNETGVKTHSSLKKAAFTKLSSFKTVEDLDNFLMEYENKITNLEVDSTIVRMLFSSASNKVAKAWANAKTRESRLNILANNPDLLISLRAITIMTQRGATSAGRVLNAQKIKVDEINSILSRIIDSTQVIRKVSDKARADGVDVEEAIKEGISDKDMDALMEEMARLIEITDGHNDVVSRTLTVYDRTEHWFKKFLRASTESWLSANLTSLATHTGALAGSLLKRSTMKGESYLNWSIGKAFNVKDRLKYNEMQALNEMDWHQSIETYNMIKRMLKGGTGEGMEGILQRESLDGWNTRYDDDTSHGAINADYLGFEDPKTNFAKIVNKSFDVTGKIIRSPFTALALADDIFKRVYYLPHIKYQLTKEANQKFPDNDQKEAHKSYISKGVAAYELFYVKKGMRINTVKIHVAGEMEKFNKANPDATYDEIELAKFNAREGGDALVTFTPEEQKLLDEVGIDQQMHEASIGYTREMLFQAEIPIDTHSVTGRALGVIKDIRDVTPLMQTQVPYLKTTLNMAKDTIQHIPLMNMLSRDIRADLAAGGPKRVEAVSKMVMGTSIGALGVLLYDNGFITATTEMKDYQTDSAAGVPGGSLRIPGTDTYIPLARIEPWGSYLRFAADGRHMLQEAERLRDIMDDAAADTVDVKDYNIVSGWAKDHAFIMGSLSFNILTEKSGATSLKKLMDVMENPESDAAEQWLYQYTAGFIPLHAGIKQFNEDPVTYEAKTFMENIRKKLGVMSEEWGDRDTINYLGEIDNELHRLPGFYWRSDDRKKDDYVLSKLYELQPGIRRADAKLYFNNGVIKDLSYKEAYELRTLMDHPEINVRARLFETMATKEFQELPVGNAGENVAYGRQTQVFAIRNVYSEAKRDAQKLYISIHKEALKKEYGDSIEKSRVSSLLNTPAIDQRKKVMSNTAMDDFIQQFTKD